MSYTILISGDYAWSFIKDIEYSSGYSNRGDYVEKVRYCGIGGDAGLLSAILSGEGWKVYAQATLDKTGWSDMIERELRRHDVSTEFLTRTRVGGGAVNFEEHSIDKHGLSKETYYSRGTWSKYARHRPLTAREEVPELLSKLDFVPDYYAFNAPEAGYRALAKALKEKGTKIVYFGFVTEDSPAQREALSLADIHVTGIPWKIAFVFTGKEYYDQDIEEFYRKDLPLLDMNRMPSKHKLIYVHGSNSAGDSRTSHALRDALPDWSIIAPDCPTDPFECMDMLRALIDQEKPDVVIGSSMGGFYVHQLRGVRRICINPAFWLTEDEDIQLGNHANRNTARKNGVQHYTITEDIFEKFRKMQEHQFDDINSEDSDNMVGLFGTLDDDVPYSKEVFMDKYRGFSALSYEGNHSIGKENIEKVLVPILNGIK